MEHRTLLAVRASATLKSMVGLVQLVVMIGLMLFVPAGTLKYPEGLTFFAGSSLTITLSS